MPLLMLDVNDSKRLKDLSLWPRHLRGSWIQIGYGVLFLNSWLNNGKSKFSFRQQSFYVRLLEK